MFIAAVLLIALLLSGLRIAQEYQRGVILRLGRYVGLRGPGLYWIIPLGIESPRVLRRLQPLRRWSHEQFEQVLT